jgi:aspartyl protease family protein
MWKEYGHILVQIIILVSLLSVVFIRAKQDNSPVLQYFAQWLLLFFFIILAYTYKDEFSHIKERIVSAIYPGYVANYNADELVVYQNKDGHFYLNTIINGTEILLMVDTGATTTVLSDQDARKLGFSMDNLQFDRSMRTAGGVVAAANINLNQVEIGDVIFENVPAMVSGNGSFNTSLAGMTLLKRFSAYKFRGNKLHLYYATPSKE